MLALKIAGGMIITVSGAMGGLFAAKRLERQCAAVSDYIAFLTYSESMIGYCAADIAEILSDADRFPYLEKIITDVSSYLAGGKEFSRAWKTAVSDSAERGEIGKSDIRLIASFGEGFGAMGAEEEIRRIRLHKDEAQRRLSELRPQLEAKRRLYRVVGTFCGMLAAVIII